MHALTLSAAFYVFHVFCLTWPIVGHFHRFLSLNLWENSNKENAYRHGVAGLTVLKGLFVFRFPTFLLFNCCSTPSSSCCWRPNLAFLYSETIESSSYSLFANISRFLTSSTSESSSLWQPDSHFVWNCLIHLKQRLEIIKHSNHIHILNFPHCTHKVFLVIFWILSAFF